MNRSGITLVEVLVAIFIMGIGLLALLTLFPLGAISMAQQVQADRAASNLRSIADAMHAHYELYSRFPARLADIFPAAKYPSSGAKDGYKVFAQRLEASSATILNEPGVPGVHGIYTAVAYVGRSAGKPVTQIILTPTPGALDGIRKLHEKLLDAAARGVSELIGLLPASEQAMLYQSLMPYLGQMTNAQGFPLLQGADGKVSLVSIRDKLAAQGDPAIRSVLAEFWERVARALHLGEYGQDWERLPGLSAISGNASTSLFSFVALRQLTTTYVTDLGLLNELTGHLGVAEQAAIQGLIQQKELALAAYVDLVRRNAGVRVPAGQANTLVHIASTL
jgi:type II secretory pathway pseudopilin PulG